MKIITRTAAAAMLISLPMALGACGGGGDKPSQADVEAGYIKALKNVGGSDAAKIPDSLYQKMAGCIFDKTYDKLSNDTLNKMKDGNATEKTKIKSSDQSKLESASNTCSKKYAAEIQKAG